MATTTKRWVEERPPKGERCRRRIDEKYCNRLIDAAQREKGWTWDADCVRDHHATKRAERKSDPKPTRQPKKSSVTKLPASVTVHAPIAPEAMAAFASPELAVKAVAKRRSQRAERPTKA